MRLTRGGLEWVKIAAETRRQLAGVEVATDHIT